MRLEEIQECLLEGENLFYAYQKIFLISEINVSRPRKKVRLTDIETGSHIWCRPEAVHHGVGHARETLLPYKQITPFLGRNNGVQAVPYYDVDDNPVVPGTRILLQDGERGIYLGLSRRDLNIPIVFQKESGERAKCSFDWVSEPKVG